MKKKRFAIVTVASVLILSLLVVLWMRRDSDLSAVLSSAGFARLPEAAHNLRIDSQGSLFDTRVTLVKFEAAPDDLRHFVECSSINDGKQPGVMDVRLNAVTYPSWWPRKGEPFGQRTYVVQSGDFASFATVDYERSTICIQMFRGSRLLRRMKRYIPFI